MFLYLEQRFTMLYNIYHILIGLSSKVFSHHYPVSSQKEKVTCISFPNEMKNLFKNI